MPIYLEKDSLSVEVISNIDFDSYSSGKFNSHTTNYFYELMLSSGFSNNVVNEYYHYCENCFNVYCIELDNEDKKLLELNDINIETNYFYIHEDSNNGFISGNFVKLEDKEKYFNDLNNEAQKFYEMEERIKSFLPHGVYTVSNCISYLIELSKCGDSARIKLSDNEITEWLEIEYIPSCDDCNSECECELMPVIDKDNYVIPLNSIIRI